MNDGLVGTVCIHAYVCGSWNSNEMITIKITDDFLGITEGGHDYSGLYKS